MQKKGISVIIQISRNAAMDKNNEKNIKEIVYLVVLALLQIFFQPTSMFWLSIIRERSNTFCHWLLCIAIDEAHLMWGWKKFCKEFSNIRNFQLVFLKVPIIAIAVTMTPNIIQYV